MAVKREKHLCTHHYLACILEAQPGDEQVKWFSFDEEVYREDVACLLIMMIWASVGEVPALGTVNALLCSA